MDIKLNKVFIVQKENRIVRWKVIEHPYFYFYALVRDYCDLHGAMSSNLSKRDYNHICGPTTLETAYQDAYTMT